LPGAEVARKDWTECSRLRALAPVMTMTGEGLVLGATVLVKMGRDRYGMQELALDGAAERILALLAVVYGKAVGPEIIGYVRRASNRWRQGETALAEIELALGGLQQLNDVEAASLSLSLGERLLADGTTPRELMKACGLDPAPLDLLKAGYSPNQPRVPGGNPDGGQWTSDDAPAISRPDHAAPTPVRPINYTSVQGLPAGAKIVMPPGGIPIPDKDSPTKKPMAPPYADFRQIYAAGQAIASLPLLEQYSRVRAAIGQEGASDLQRDVPNKKFYHAYTPAANYAV
jgi:hypothetical protein